MSSCKSGCHFSGRRPHHGRGPSSFWMHDPDEIFGEIGLENGDVFLDIGCGTGDYSLRAAEEVGVSGIVYASDIQERLVENLKKRAEDAGLNNIRPFSGDLYDPVPFEDSTVDVCLISTVLHSVDPEDAGRYIFPEIRRVLKPEGRLVIIECKKEVSEFGPPLHMRISADEIEKQVCGYGFEKASLLDLGHNYMITFR